MTYQNDSSLMSDSFHISDHPKLQGTDWFTPLNVTKNREWAWVNTQVPVSIQVPVHLLYMFNYVHGIDFDMKQVIALGFHCGGRLGGDRMPSSCTWPSCCVYIPFYLQKMQLMEVLILFSQRAKIYCVQMTLKHRRRLAIKKRYQKDILYQPSNFHQPLLESTSHFWMQMAISESERNYQIYGIRSF